MKGYIKYIFIFLFTGFFAISCTHSSYLSSEIIDDSLNDGDKTRLLLTISTLDNGLSTSEPIEKIKSVRIIILNVGGDSSTENDNEGIVELNRFIELQAVSSSAFTYIMTWPTLEGNKNIYVIANESSISPSITDILDSYQENEVYADLETLLDDYSFVPNYKTETGNVIYLPYTYCSKNVIVAEKALTSVNALLLPVATKFIFNFTNDRTNPVDLNEVSIAFTNKSDYLFPRVAETQQFKEYGDTTLFWLDWLEKVSLESNDYPGYSQNENFNNLVGWITDYDIPSPSDYSRYYFNSAENTITIPAATIEEVEGVINKTASQYIIGPVYIPESANYLTPTANNGGNSDNTGKGNQTYYLTMALKDQASGKGPLFNDFPIANLKALFRNTYVIFNIYMGEGDIEVFAEIAPWNVKMANGWITEGNEPNPNPFPIKKKF